MLNELIIWYENQCNGEWEHQNGINFSTLDNPGWQLIIDLVETNLSGKEFSPLKVNRSETDWFHIKVKDNKFQAAAGVRNLDEIISIFVEWSKKY
jgi:Immunity protein 53